MGRALRPDDAAGGKAAGSGQQPVLKITDMVMALRRKKMLQALEQGGPARVKMVQQADQMIAATQWVPQPRVSAPVDAQHIAHACIHCSAAHLLEAVVGAGRRHKQMHRQTGFYKECQCILAYSAVMQGT
jgi:hypothetical protein